MRSYKIQRCAEPGCPAFSIRRHCEAHQTPKETTLRSWLDVALVRYADAEDAYVAAVRADDPSQVIAALADYQAADARVRVIQYGLGMVP